MRGRALVVGSGLLLSSQVTIALVQFGYAALVSRIIAPGGFGDYAVALAAVGLASIFTTAGIGAATARAPELGERQQRGLVRTALVLGVVGTATTVVLAAPWARLWGQPTAVGTVQLAGLVLLLGPLAAVMLNIMRREGRYHAVAVVTLSAGVVALALGTAAAWWARSAESLLVPAIVIPALQAAGAIIALGRLILPRRDRLSAGEEGRFARRASGVDAVAYLVGNLPAWCISLVFGAPSLGAFNRATVVSSVPLYMLQSSALSTVYPELREGAVRSDRAARTRSDIVLLMAWVAMPVTVGIAVLGSLLIETVLGPQWQESEWIVPFLAVSAGIYLPTMVLYSVVETHGRFRPLLVAQLIALAATVVGAALTFLRHSSVPVLLSMSVGALLIHAVQLRVASRAGLVDGKVVQRGYAELVLPTALFLLFTLAVRWTVLTFIDSPALRLLAAGLLLCVAAVLALPWLRSATPLRLARQYGVGRGTATASLPVDVPPDLPAA